MNRKDRILIAAVLVFAAVLAAVFFIKTRLLQRKDPAVVTVTIDGELYGAFALSEDREVDIDTKYGHNHLSIRGGSAQVTEADCPDGLCMHQGRISQNGEMNVCLPHRLIAEVISGDGSGVDGISK
ncbi:MAG: NusG domain II-containing protein [Lachnospiraceae bacterium]|nr:NusG domain II-containing protein [Lachnospiraceae bacterium]